MQFTKEQLTEILEKHKLWLSSDKERGTRAYLSHANLSHAYLKGVNLEGANLAGADLRGTNLKGACLREVNLKGANLEKANLEGAILERADLGWACLTRANLLGANLAGANLEEAIMYYATLTVAKLHGANLAGADLLGAKLIRANLEEANLEEANLYEASLIGANLEGANLEGANLRWADLEGANLIGVDLEGAILGKANMKVRVSAPKGDSRSAELEVRIDGEYVTEGGYPVRIYAVDGDDGKVHGAIEMTRGWVMYAWHADGTPVDRAIGNYPLKEKKVPFTRTVHLLHYDTHTLAFLTLEEVQNYIKLHLGVEAIAVTTSHVQTMEGVGL